MPIYEYLCEACDHRFEVKQGVHDAPLTSCSRCSGSVTKVISAPAIMFKGSGWYVTDYSDKLKAPGESTSGEKPVDGQPAGGQKEQKEKKETTAAPASEGTATGSKGESSSGSTDSSNSGSGGSSTPSS